MAFKCIKFTATIVSKRLGLAIDLHPKFKVIHDNGGGKSVMVIACQSGMSHDTVAMNLKDKSRVMGAVKRAASLKVTR